MYFDSPADTGALSPALFRFYKDIEFYKPTILKNFHNLTKKKPLDEDLILSYIAGFPDKLILIKFSLSDKTLAKWCQDKNLSLFWDKIWELSCTEIPPTDQQYPETLVFNGRKPQTTISSYQLICGAILYDEAKQLVESKQPAESEGVMTLLKQAAQLGNYDALAALTNINYELLCKNQIDFSQTLFNLLENAANWHGTPIYLLYAINCYYMGTYYKVHQNDNEKQNSFQNALTYLHLADWHEETSADAIHNAYYGQGIAMSNAWKMGNMAQFKKTLIEDARLSDISTTLALSTAETIDQQQLTRLSCPVPS